MSALVPFNDRQLALIRKTVAKDCDRNSEGVDLRLGEFDWFAEICKTLKLDPLRRQIYAFVFSKDDMKRRQMVPIVAIGGYRAIAARTGNYRPSEQPPAYEYDESAKDPLANPKGLIKATVTVWQYLHGAWHPVRDEARWDAYAPIIDAPEGGYTYEDTGEVWEDTGKPKKRRVANGKVTRRLDPGKDRWRVDPEGMLSKCAEALTLRKAWPDDFAGTYVEGEMDRAEVMDLSPSELANAAETTERMAKIGGPNQLLVDWLDGGPLQPIAVGKFGDAALQFIATNREEPSLVLAWESRNRHTLKEYWARDKDGALTVKAAIEKISEAPMAAE